MIYYIKTIFTKPKEIYTARNMKNSHYFLLLLATCFILTFLSIFEILPVAHQFSDDYEEIYSSIPDLDFVDGKLESETESYIYQSNSIMFYFDSEDRITIDKIESDRPVQSAPISIGILKNQIYLNAAINNNYFYVNAAGTSYSFVYDNFEKLTSKDLMELIKNIGNFSIGMYLLLIVILFVVNLFIYLTELIPITLFANLISVYRKTRMSFV